MEKTLKPTLTFTLKQYFTLTKPGIIFGNAVTAFGGFALASKGRPNLSLFLMMLLGISLVIGSACSFNNYIDRKLDAKMARTKNRALVTGLISEKSAIYFASLLALLGFCVLIKINFLTTLTALFGFLVYVFVYSYSKYHTHHGTIIGSFAGAVPPVVGYLAVTNKVDLGALILFLTIATWQMPHFFAIAIYRLEDYRKGSIPVLPLRKGMKTTKIYMLLSVMVFILASSLLTAFNYTNTIYLLITLLLGCTWLYLSFKGFKAKNDTEWARKMFILSIVIVMIQSSVISFCTT